MEDTLKNLQSIQSQLITIKDDKTKYIKSSDIEPIVIALRSEIERTENYPDGTDEELKAQIETQVEDTFELLSMFYLLLGRNKEAPAQYALSTIIKILMPHLEESGIYSNADLNPIEEKLNLMDESARRASELSIPRLTKQLVARTEASRELLKKLRERLEPLPTELEPLYDKLVSIRRQITAAAARKKVAPGELRDLQQKLDEMNAAREDGNFLAADGSTVSGNQDLVQDLFNQCIELAQFFASHDVKVNPTLQDTYDALAEVKGQLDKQMLTQDWSLRETDLFGHMKILRSIDRKRVNGKFVGTDGNSPEEGQKVLLYLLRKSYAMVYHLLSQSKPVSEALQPMHNQLHTLKKCLLEVQKSGGLSSPRDLFPFSMKLASIDNMRKEGKFYVGSEIPEGQGSLNELLSECYELCHELRCAVEESEDRD